MFSEENLTIKPSDHFMYRPIICLKLFFKCLLQQRELYPETSSNKRYTIFDKIFKGALEKFRKDLKSMIAIEVQVSEVEMYFLFVTFKILNHIFKE